MKPITWVVLSLLALLTTAQAASFDCEKAHTKIEKMICNNRDLSELDSKMDKAYKDALSVYDYYKGQEVTYEQREWLDVRNSCSNKACVKQAYLSRMKKLHEPFAPRPYRAPDEVLKDVTVTTLNPIALRIANSNEYVDDFNKDIGHYHEKGKITRCSLLIELPGGTAHNGYSMGGACVLLDNDKSSDVMICNDNMVGNFKMIRVDHEVTKQELVDFIESNCVGG